MSEKRVLHARPGSTRRQQLAVCNVRRIPIPLLPLPRRLPASATLGTMGQMEEAVKGENEFSNVHFRGLPF